MSKRIILSAGLMLAAGLAAATSQSAAAALHATVPIMDATPRGSLLWLVDARSYRHCHNISWRRYCHKSERLPRNWPPNTNTPGTSSLRETHSDKGGTSSNRRWSRRR